MIKILLKMTNDSDVHNWQEKMIPLFPGFLEPQVLSLTFWFLGESPYFAKIQTTTMKRSKPHPQVIKAIKTLHEYITC